MMTGCSKEPVKIQEPELPVVEEPVVEEPVVEEPSVMEVFEALLVPETDAGDLGRFIAMHISETEKDQAEEMIEWLVIYQTQMIEKMNRIIYEEAYMTALNHNMEGVLTPNLVDTIEDAQIRLDFQDLIDANLTIVRYEETPVIEIDWEAIAGYAKYFSEDFAYMTIYFDRIQNGAYGAWDKDFEALYDAAVFVEAVAQKHERSFLSSQLDGLYQRQVGNLLVGPEGGYLDAFIKKSGEPYESLMAGKERYPDSRLSQLVEALENSSSNDFMELINSINFHAGFGIRSKNEFVYGFVEEYKVTEVYFPEDKMLEDRINLLIEENVLNLMSEPNAEDIYVNSTVEYANDDFLSLYISVSYTDSGGGYGYNLKQLVIDMKTGKPMVLSDYFGMPYKDIEDELVEMTGVTFIGEPDFSIRANGISLQGEGENQPYGAYASLTLKQLIPWIDYTKHFK
jgi:hypothetical protein